MEQSGKRKAETPGGDSPSISASLRLCGVKFWTWPRQIRELRQSLAHARMEIERLKRTSQQRSNHL